MTKDDNDSEGLGKAHPALWESKMSKADDFWIKSKCFILKYIKICFDEEKSSAMVRSDYHEVCLYETMFKAGFWLLFIPIVRELLHYLNLAPIS